jgi:Uma2 family endonuclease
MVMAFYGGGNMFEDIETSGTGIMTAEQLERVQIPGKSTELVRGRLVVREPPGTFHGNVAARLLLRLGAFVEANDLGEVFAQDTGFRIASDPDTVRAPDVAFVARDRLGAVASRGYARMAPDVIAEILSPDDKPGDVIAKIREWLAAGVRLAWLLDPDRRSARVYRPDGSVSEMDQHGALDGEAVLPGFRCWLRDVYRD